MLNDREKATFNALKACFRHQTCQRAASSIAGCIFISDGNSPGALQDVFDGLSVNRKPGLIFQPVLAL